MRKHNFLRSALCLIMALVCNVAWAEKIQPSTTFPDKGVPEHVYTMMNGNNVYANGLTAPTQTEANYGQFAFYAVNGVEGAYYIYSHTAKKWLTYTKAGSYNNGKDFVKMADAKEADDYFHVDNYADDFYQIRPYNTTGVAGKYLNWFQGVSGNPLDGTNTLGLWQDNATNDNGSRYSFTEIEIEIVTTEVVSLSQLSNDKVYTLSSARAFLFYHPNFTKVVSSTGKAVGTSDEQDGEQDGEQDDDSDSSFAEPDNSTILNGTPAENLKAIFEATGPSIITSMGRAMNITDEQYQEIAEFTTKQLVSGKSTQTSKYQAIFDWVKNLTYNNTNISYSNDPYDVFINRICVCQGYSNLLVVMCYSQGIPAVVVNGILDGYGGHAWAYVYTDGIWKVSDPTNKGSFNMSDPSQYTHLIPRDADVDLFADDVAVYRYNDYSLNVDRVTATENPLVVPYSAGGFVINSFNPTEALPEEITEVYIGENIKTFGETNDMRLKISNYGKNLQAIHVDENNPSLLSHKGIVYRKNGDESQLYYIPGGAETLEFLPMETVDKETVKDHKNVRVIYFPEGCTSFEAYAIENCPQLEKVYIPEGVDFPSNALYNCPAGVEVISGSIPNSVTLDNSPQDVEVISDNISNSLTLDKTNPNHQFRIEKKGGNYYLYSVGAKKYVAKDGSYSQIATDALTLTDVSANRPEYPWQLAIGGNGMNSQAPNQTDEGIIFNGWTTTDDGNCYKIEVAVPKSYEYTIHMLGTEGATVTYNEEKYQNGDTFSTDAALKVTDFTASEVDKMFSIINIDGFNVYVSYFANDTKFYTIKNGYGGYVSLADGYTDGGNLLLSNTNVPKDNKALWAFVPADGGGYKIYNYSTGLTKILGMTGSEADARATMVAPDATTHTTTFDGNIKFDGTDGRIKLKGSDNNYWNKRGNFLALWNNSLAAGNDTGSKFFLEEADHISIPDEYIHEISDIKGIDTFIPENPNTLWYKTSAEAAGVSYPWMEYALPLGNGELGCMVFGGVAHEELQFNEKTLWSGPANTVGAGGGNRTFMNFGSLIIANKDNSIFTKGVTDYVRYLDIEEGIAGVSFKNANGTKQTRKYLSSAPDQVIAGQYKVTEGDDKLDLVFSLEPGNSINASAVTYEGNTASFSGKMTVEYAARLHVVADNGATVTATNAGISVKNATEVTFYLKGATNFDGDRKAINSYFTADNAAVVNTRIEADIEKAEAKGFDAIEEDHVADFTAITKRMTLSLGLTTPTVDTKTLIDNYYPNNGDGNSTQNDHLFLEQLYFHYGRYLAISSNRKDIAAPNNLQGIWNDRGTDSPWNSDIHTNINIQMNYWPTEITNLSDLHKPFVNFIIRGAQSEGWKEVGKQYNDGHGWSVLTETSLYNSMSTWGSNYLVANVWYTSHLWMHYRYTQDKEFLKEAFPVMWSAAEFWFHRLIPDKGYDSATQNSDYRGTAYNFEPDGTYVAPNEYSAEQNAHNSEDGTAHAQQMISYLFENISEAITILGRENINLTDDQIATLNDYLAKTDKGLHTEIYTANSALNSQWTNPRNGVAKGETILREWKYSPYDVSDDPGHRHLSHLMALFPMDQITPESPYFEPAVNSLKLRGDAATGWSMGWKVNLWARAQDGDHAHIIIKNALKHSTDYGTNAGAGGIYYNLFDSHAPFQIDGNFGVCSGIAEMLMQSAHGYINILPALPKVWEAKGAITGMKAIGNFTVDFNWQDGKAQKVTIVSNAGAVLKVRCNRGAMDIAKAKITVAGNEVAAVVENGIATIPCTQGQTVVIDFTQEATPNTKPVDGYYLMYSESSSGKGWVHYNGSLDRKYRVATDVDLSTEVTTEQAQYIWKLVNDNENGTFTLWNLGGNVYMPADAERNKNMGATTPANLAIEAVGGEGNEGKWFVSQTNYTNNGNTLYIHTNKPGGYPNLSYWDSKSVDGTSIRAKFTKLPESTYTINYMCGEEIVASTEVSYPTGLAVPETLLQRDVPTGYLVQGNGTLSGTTYTINVVNIFPEAGEYIRIGYDFGGNAGVKYMQSTASGVSGKDNALLMTDEKGEGSIFLVEEVSGNLRLKSISTGKYLKEDNSNRGLATEGANVTFTEGADGKIKIQATSYLHPNVSGTTYFVDRCDNDGCDQHNLIVEEVTLPDDGGDDGGDDSGDDDNQEVTSADALPGDGILRYYRLAIPVTESAYNEDLGSNKDKVKAFWQECENFANKMFVPLGFCFDVVMDERLINVTNLPINPYNGLPEIGNCTYDLNTIIGETNYDVAMWVIHRDDFEENSGLSALNGAYTPSQKGSGYAKTDKWVVAHELGHMFGAVHTLQGEGSLMDNKGEYFSYPSIKAIRNSAKGTSSYDNVKVANNAPQFDPEKMQKTYRIPQGACLAIDVQATDIEGHKLMYSAIGCNSTNVDNVQEGQAMTLPFASFAPQESNIISYAPIYTADLFYDDYFYLKDGTGITKMDPGSYPLSILVNDVPSMATWTYTALEEEPFYSTYAIWEAQVEIVGGEAFNAALSPAKPEYTAGETVTVTWGVNKNYFANNSNVRISLSDDYGKTFDYVLAEEVSAHAGFCTVTLPNVNVGQVDVDFTTAVRRMNGGVIKVEEIGGPAFTLTALAPTSDKGFTISGGEDAVNKVTSSISSHEIGTFYANEPMTIPAGVTAYVATTTPDIDKTEGSIVMTAITDGIIPAKTGVVIRGREGTYTFIQAKERGTEVIGNLMRGYAGTKASDFVTFPEDGSVNYVLTVKNGVAGFYKKTAGFNVANHRAYLNVPTEGKANALRIRFADDEGTTEIEGSELGAQGSELIFDITGRRIEKIVEKGMYIVNGKKVVIR